MNAAFTAVYRKKGPWYMAFVEELPGANSQGRTLEEAQENLKDAVELILAANKELTEKNPRRRRIHPRTSYYLA